MAAARVPKKSADRTKSVRSLVKDAFQLTIECGICTEIKELRQLPCQHMMCYDCLNTIISRARGEGLQPECSFCKAKLTREAGDYPVSRLVANLRTEVEQLEKALSATTAADDSQLCQMDGCQRHVDYYCRKCQLYVCHNCSKSKCKAHTSELVDSELLNANMECAKREHEKWKAQKMGEITAARNKQNRLINKLKEETAKASEANICNVLERVATLSDEIRVATKAVVKETTVYQKYESDINGVSDTEFIRLVEKLSVEDGNKTDLVERSRKDKAIHLNPEDVKPAPPLTPAQELLKLRYKQQLKNYLSSSGSSSKK